MQRPEHRQDWEIWIEQQIREAQERGAFDNLPGKGQPLILMPNPYAKEQEMAFKILKDAGLAPEWIELGKTIRARLDSARITLARQRDRRQIRMAELEGYSDQWATAERQRVLAGWEQAVETFQHEIDKINQTIAEYNLKVPGAQFQRSPIHGTRELERLEAEQT